MLYLLLLLLFGQAFGQTTQPSVDKIERLSKMLVISGQGLRAERVRVFINGVEQTSRITLLTDRQIVLSGSDKRLGLRTEDNEVEVLVNGRRYTYYLIKTSAVQNVRVEVGQTVTLELDIADDDDYKLTFSCDRGDFVKLEKNLLRISPKRQDLGLTTCKLKVTDSGGLSTEMTFFIEVVPCGQPILFNPVGDLLVSVGEARLIDLRTENPCGTDQISLRLVVAPNYVTLTDKGNGMGTLRVAPIVGDTSGRVIVDARDTVGLFGQLSFGIQIKVGASINSVIYLKPNLLIEGMGFGNTVRVSVNNQDISARIAAQTDRSITLRGNKKKLNLKRGPNLIKVILATGEALEYVYDLN